MKKMIVTLLLLTILFPGMIAGYRRKPNVGFSFGIGTGYPGSYYGYPRYYGYPYRYYGPGLGFTIPLGGDYDDDEILTESRIARDNAGKAYWEVINKTDATLTVLSDRDEIRHLAPGTSGTLYREDDFEFTVKSNGIDKKFTTDQHLVTIHKKNGNLSL